MSGRYLIDTNIVVDFFKGSKTISMNLIQKEIYIPSIVVGELYFGAYASRIIKNLEMRLEEISSFLEFYPILDVDKITAEYYGKIKTNLKKEGTPIPENDIWIAALALKNDLTLVTNDHHFSHIQFLDKVVW